MWAGEKGAHGYLVNIIWPLTPFTADNGATHIYPHSHGADGMAKTDPGEPIVAACDHGAATCFLGSTAHGAGATNTDPVRRGARPEARGAGTEGVGTCRSRWATGIEQKNTHR